MTAGIPEDSHPLIRRLGTIAVLSDAERAAIRALPLTVRDYPAGADIIRERDRPAQCCLLLDGFLCRYRIVAGGRRQIFSFHLPGDMPDLQSLHLEVMDHALAPIVPSTVAFIAHADIRALYRALPRIGEIFWRATLIDAAMFREWMTGLGSRDAYQRTAHLLCELYVRLESIGLARDFAYDIPMTQQELGDALGITTVHVNRTLRQLREAGVVSIRRARVQIHSWANLAAIAGGFDPTYLHLVPLAQP